MQFQLFLASIDSSCAFYGGGSINRSLLNKAKFKLLIKDICIEETSIYGLPFTSLTTLCDNQMERDMCIRTHRREKRIPRKDIRMYLLEPIFKIDWSRSYFLSSVSFPYTSQLSLHISGATLFLVHTTLLFELNIVK